MTCPIVLDSVSEERGIWNDSVAVELAQFFKMIDKNVTLAIPNDKLMPLADDYLSDYLINIFMDQQHIALKTSWRHNPLQEYKQAVWIGIVGNPASKKCLLLE